MGLIRRPAFRWTVADTWEVYMGAENETRLDWLKLGRALSAAGVPFRVWPVECSEAVLWRLEHEATLRMLGLWTLV